MPTKLRFHARRPPGLPCPADDYRGLARRVEANRFYAGVPWRKLRLAFLREHPTCDECGKLGRVELATDVHHVRERRDHPGLALDPDNLQALCKRCHAAKRLTR